MKNILVITTRNPYSGRLSGDVIGSLKIINYLKKKHKVSVVTLGKKKFNLKNVLFFDEPNYLLKILYVFVSFVKMKPLQFGLFFSQDMKKYVEEHAKNYDLLFFYHIRSSQYLPKNYSGNKIIEMGDLYSHNYFQTFCNLNLVNPLKYVYLIESLLVKKIEKKIFTVFEKIILFSKNEIKKIPKQFKKKIFNIDLSVDTVQNKFLFSNKNNRILFVGNLGYLPNFLATKDFIKNTLPNLKKIIPEIEFCIIGNINKFDKFFLSFHQNVKILGQKKNIAYYVKNSICGLANLEIATGVQGKVLDYMRYGLPVICSKKVASNFVNKIISYDNNIDLIKKISNLKNNKKLSNKLSKKSLKFVRNLSKNKIGLQYLKIVKFNKKLS